MTKENKQIQVSQELLERAKQVREYVAATNSVIKELIGRDVEITFYFNGQKLDCVLGSDFEIRMHILMEPITL